MKKSIYKKMLQKDNMVRITFLDTEIKLLQKQQLYVI